MNGLQCWVVSLTYRHFEAYIWLLIEIIGSHFSQPLASLVIFNLLASYTFSYKTSVLLYLFLCKLPYKNMIYWQLQSYFPGHCTFLFCIYSFLELNNFGAKWDIILKTKPIISWPFLHLFQVYIHFPCNNLVLWQLNYHGLFNNAKEK